MHELSIAVNIVEISEEEVKKSGKNKVTEIEIEVGKMSGIVVDALEFALDEAVRDSVLEGAKRIIIEVPAVAKCADCNCEFEADDHFSPCTSCGYPYSDIIAGKELKIIKLQVE